MRGKRKPIFVAVLHRYKAVKSMAGRVLVTGAAVRITHSGTGRSSVIAVADGDLTVSMASLGWSVVAADGSDATAWDLNGVRSHVKWTGAGTPRLLMGARSITVRLGELDYASLTDLAAERGLRVGEVAREIITSHLAQR